MSWRAISGGTFSAASLGPSRRWSARICSTVRIVVNGGLSRSPAAAAINVSEYVCVRDLPTLDAWIARARTAGVVAFDTETDALSSANAALCGVSLAVAPGEACYIPVGHENESTGGLEFEAPEAIQQLELDAVIARLKPLLEDPTVLKVAQNAKYDIAVLDRHGIKVAPIEVTMLISYALEGGLHKSDGMDELS